MFCLHPSPGSVAVAIGIAGLPTVVRQVRAAFVSERAKDCVLAAKATGTGRCRIAVWEILPNRFGPILVRSTLALGGAVSESAGLALLGLSGQPDVAEWGDNAALGGERVSHRARRGDCLDGAGVNLISDSLRQRWR
jgi:peptide/nickel transport system permease protein